MLLTYLKQEAPLLWTSFPNFADTPWDCILPSDRFPIHRFKGFADSPDESSLAMQNYFALREKVLHRQFPDALPLDDFMGRLEMELCKYGFRADNSIGAVANSAPSLQLHLHAV
jgi:hypothetical protein